MLEGRMKMKMPLDTKETWKNCCAKEGVRFAKKGSDEHERVKKRFQKKVMLHQVQEKQVLEAQRRMDNLLA